RLIPLLERRIVQLNLPHVHPRLGRLRPMSTQPRREHREPPAIRIRPPVRVPRRIQIRDIRRNRIHPDPLRLQPARRSIQCLKHNSFFLFFASSRLRGSISTKPVPAAPSPSANTASAKSRSPSCTKSRFSPDLLPVLPSNGCSDRETKSPCSA